MTLDSDKSLVKILIAEDEDSIVDILVDLLQQEDRQITLVQNGIEALKALHKEPYDLLITDLKMPEVDGMKVLHEAKKLYPDIIVIIVTGYASLETAIQAVKEGAYDYLRKPFRLEELKISVDNACEKIRLKRENERLLEFVKRCRPIEEDSDERRMEARHGAGEELDDNIPFVQKTLFGPEWYLPFISADSGSSMDRGKVIDEIERLARLKAQGIITNEEFEMLKKKLFASI